MSTHYQQLTDAETLAFTQVFPALRKWCDFAPPLHNHHNNDYSVHAADQHRARKRLNAEMRALLEQVQEQKRNLTDNEERALEAGGKILENFDYSEYVLENNKLGSSARDFFSSGTSGLGQPEKIIFRSTEKISDFRAPSNELRNLSIGRMMNIMANGAERARATEKEQRALQEGTGSAGGYTVPTPLLSQFIDKMRVKSVCSRAGASTVLLGSNKVSIARLASDPVAAWRLELGNVATSDATFEKVDFSAKSLAVMVRISRELLADSVNVDPALENALA